MTKKKFELHKTYKTRVMGDHSAILEMTVISRTDYRVTIDCEGDILKKAICVNDTGDEYIRLGTYSSAPVFRA